MPRPRIRGEGKAGKTCAITAAFAVAVAIGVARLVRKESVQPAVSGVFGVALAGGVVWFTGSAKDYFLIGIWGSLAGAILLLASVLVRWPLAGAIWNGATGKGHIWRADKRSRLYYDIATLVMAALFGARFAVKQYFYETDQIGSLGIAKIALGFPLLALGFPLLALGFLVFALGRAALEQATDGHRPAARQERLTSPA